MRLFIAEKPSLGKGIAHCLPGPKKSGNGFIECGDTVVTWAFGHIFKQAEPDEYTPDTVPLTPKGKKQWRMEDLPIFPDKWFLRPDPDAKDQIKLIRDLLKKAGVVVNAGDEGREGQLLVDEILEELGWRGPTQRILVAALDEQSVKKALANLRNNDDFQNLSAAARARSRADWLMGMNLTRAFTLRNSGSGVVSVGRVQTPTLALVVSRDLAIENFKPKDFFVPRIHTQGFWSSWEARDDLLDADGYLVDHAVADSLAQKAKQAGKATVAEYESREKRQGAPLGFSLAELQKVCSAKFGMTAKQVLDTAQALYETHKATTYPRSDCRYLPEEQHGEAGRVLQGLAGLGYGDLVKGADTGRKSAIWNTKKITEHHAIIPTGSCVGSLSGNVQKVFDLIVRSYLAQFYPPYVYKATKVLLDCADEQWKATANVPVSAGWKAVYGMTDEDEEQQAVIPVLQKGQVLPVADADVQAKQTKPPARFSDGTLIEAMSNIHKFVADEEAKKKLKETAGIGTEATRAAILETLVQRGFIERKGKQIVSTKAGRAVVKALPKELTDPVLTARWEDVLSGIAEGKVPAEKFEQAMRQQVAAIIEVAKKTAFRVEGARQSGGSSGRKATRLGPICAACKKAKTVVLKTKTGKNWLKCEACGAAFWPSKDGKSCGTQWEKQ